MATQILLGSLVLAVCSALHVSFVVAWVYFLNRARDAFNSLMPVRRKSVMIGGTFAIIVISHTMQVWFISVCLLWAGAFARLDDSLYFTMVTYTTLGYGDITLGPDHRLFGAMAAVTGLLNFGISTAVLVAVINRLLLVDSETE